ncbi:hypothetical protein QQY66_11020 [Streptomyces sp. DG2A-72]|uniref:hypothetical protein n=1 Tax=Streptomyces sp. DG2A-72 TaxID=3051386 RepID=UPI00265C0638|nr:hypothetical protein [Streptomyces sp. DG2A-72]MDO0932196.1 hypothetical protein [Streptomyces sp. DG2A-72]
MISPLKDSAGQMQGALTATFDVTGQHRARERLTTLNAASTHIGTTLDVARTAREMTEVAVPGLADFVSVDLLESVHRGEEPVVGSGAGPVTPLRVAQCSVHEGCPEERRRASCPGRRTYVLRVGFQK